MNRLCTALAMVLLAGCVPAIAQDLNVRKFDRTVDPRDVTTTDRLTWYAGESIEYIVRSRRGRDVVDVPQGSTVVWRLQSGSNDFMAAEGEVVTNGTVRFVISSPDANLPAGTYHSWVQAYRGTNEVGVLDRAAVEVRWRPGDEYAIVPPVTNLFDQVLAAWHLASSAGVAEVMADLSRHADDQENPHEVTAEQLGALTAEADAAALAAVAGVESNLTAHADDQENPHGVTAEQLGALTAEADAAALAAVAGVESNLTAHADDQENPHGVTAEQLGALTEEADAAALAAVAGVESNLQGLAETVGGITAESLGALTEEEDPDFSAWEPAAHVPIVCSGGFFYSDYFTLTPKTIPLVFIGYGETQEYNSVEFQWRTFSTESGFQLDPDIARQQDWSEEVVYSDLVNLEITPNGETTIASWLPGAALGTVGSFVASLGAFSRAIEVTYSAGSAPPSSNAYWVADLPGSLRESINSNTLAAAEAVGKSAFVYGTSAYSSTSFVRNADCWAAGFDLTCASPWNSKGGRYYAGTAITPQHIAYARHFTAPTGTVFRFIDATNGVHDRTLVDQRLLAHDIAIGLLDEPLGEAITPAKVLDMDQISYLRGRYGLRNAPGIRLIYLDQQERSWLASTPLMEVTSGSRWESPNVYFSGTTNLPFSRAGAIGGDSGNPVFLVAGTNTVLLSTFYTPTSGPLLTYSRDAIEAAMADMGGSAYTNLTSPDLSTWTDYDTGHKFPDY